MRKNYWIVLIALLMIPLMGCKGEVRESEETETMAIDSGAAQEVMESGVIDTAAVQGVMNSYIQQKLEANEGAYPINEAGAEFDYLHEGVREMEGLYVSCADFKAGEDIYDVDFYVKAEDGKYSVVKEVLHMKNGEVLNEALWQQGQ